MLASPSLVYTVRKSWRRGMSRAWNRILARRLHANPLARLSLHPADIAHPAIVEHFQSLLAALLETRQAMTKSAFAASWRKIAAHTSAADAMRQYCGLF
jgi:hypothetical protein